ncbi:unnamed protein product [Effrenium voratum]|uniref:Uncharacterized protein n=1 Tax=Effrenium voratum TaxID=2562239 RepID=A0AA36JAZ7_9DINO|nr:unnamed protein product [Effrenium voratum]
MERAGDVNEPQTRMGAGHPDRIRSLADSAEAAAAGLEDAKSALEQEEQQTEQLRQKVSHQESELERLQGELRSLEAHAAEERGARQAQIQREEALRSAVEDARREQEAGLSAPPCAEKSGLAS